MWSEEKNNRRGDLIDKEVDDTLTEAERIELEELQKQAIAFRDSVAPLPMDGARKLNDVLKRLNLPKDDGEDHG
jgi:hypothetical protein